MEPLRRIEPDRSVARVELTRLTPLQREEDRRRRERERERRRRQRPAEPRPERPEDGRPGIDVRV